MSLLHLNVDGKWTRKLLLHSLSSAVRPRGVRQLGPGISRRGRRIEQAYGCQIAVHAPPPH
jgi:hypothetical protein